MKEAVDVAELIKQIFQTAVQAVAEVAARLPAHLSQVGTELAKRGWYISDSMDLSDTSQIENLLESNKMDDVDSFMTPIVRNRIPDLEKLIREHYPKRAAIVSLALDAHSRGEYALVIPTLLCQTEGICLDVVNTKLYKTKRKVPVISVVLEQYQTDDFLAAVLKPLETDLGIVARQEIRDRFPGVMNRHEVIHGIDTEYATELNSLKAISLLDYVATIMWEVVPNKKAASA